MITVLSIILFVIFSSLGFIHFYWILGGKWGLEKALPTKEAGQKAMESPKIATAIVGIGLISFGLIYLIKTGLINFQIPNWIITYGSWIIPSIFILRAIGDFNYVGVFKKIKNTEFAKADSKWFIPLCLTIGILGILIQLMNK
ncbi:DUF3995 domain-containing protein [Tenacibaculum finnmarkense]|uniref:DUF3995 domain-containing protein n=1 Tax=Tenacibaculum finnmarkense TaxID=2781243 RepID=UPI001E627E31|nr:DUF3995 domain-containing protein [Tenacibaculum finnmarkense]MCD8445685.1 DUF3995 domain-containing protein [Tenacibaculum finnmarkense genomovar ulcerans]